MYCECGCGQVTPIHQENDASKGWVKGEHMRRIRYHNRGLGTNEGPDYLVNEATGCWEWQKRLSEHGYGRLYLGAFPKPTYAPAHRFYYEIEHGPIETGLQIDHLCRNRRCVNPDHMEPVTPQVNSQRRKNARLTPEKVAEIRRRYAAGGISQAALAREYGIGSGQMCLIVNNKSWASPSRPRQSA